MNQEPSLFRQASTGSSIAIWGSVFLTYTYIPLNAPNSSKLKISDPRKTVGIPTFFKQGK